VCEARVLKRRTKKMSGVMMERDQNAQRQQDTVTDVFEGGKRISHCTSVEELSVSACVL
jgi:hypothetical protein